MAGCKPIYRSIDRSRADMIVAVAGGPVKSCDDLLGEVEKHNAGEKVMFTVVRDGERLEVPVELEQARVRLSSFAPSRLKMAPARTPAPAVPATAGRAALPAP